MYDDIDLSGGIYDFEGGGGPLISQQESLYVDDDEFYADDYYYSDSRAVPVSDDIADSQGSDLAGDDDAYYERISVSELIDQCIIPTLSQAASTVYPLLGLCIACRITCLFCSRG